MTEKADALYHFGRIRCPPADRQASSALTIRAEAWDADALEAAAV